MVKRKGIALIDVIIGSAMLAVGLGVVISMSSRSLARQSYADKQITASWLIDELFAMILVVGPEEYAKTYPIEGRFEPPFNAYSYNLEFEDESEYIPIIVNASVSWNSAGSERSLSMETMIARRHGEEEGPVERIPAEPVDREQRYWEDIEARDN
tara:strand:- start:205 stop:669 length:465 start_codon:yes stop_codon:yes gene_type:complete